jgi:hypothetical protein
VRHLLTEAEAILEEAEEAGLHPALLGGLAVFAHLGTATRETYDIDLAMSSVAEVEPFTAILTRRGYHVLAEPWWRRAVRGGGERVVVDWTGPEVVDPATLRRFRIGTERARRVLVRREVPVVGLADLLVLKLLGGRDQDVADLTLLLCTRPEAEPQTVIERAREGGALEAVRGEARRLVFAVHLGEVQESCARLLGRPLDAEQTERLRSFAHALEEGPSP